MDTILVTVDALRADHLSQYGYKRNTMPVLDELLKERTTVFDSAFSNGTHTGISLPSMLNSRYLADRPATEGPTVASVLPENVTSIGVHSNTYFAARIGRPTGFDRFEDFDVAESSEDDAVRSVPHRMFRKTMDLVRPAVERLGIRDLAESVQRAVFPSRFIHESTAYETAERTTNRALELISEVEDDVFLWVHYMDPHRPFCMHIDDPAFSNETLSSDDIHSLMSRAGIKPEKITEDERELLMDLYDSELKYTSDEISRLFDALQERGRWDDTRVIFTADHGEEFGEHGYYFHRNRPYDELLHVPLVVRRPGESGGRVSEQRELLDVAPTICKFYGVDTPDSFLGRSLFKQGDRRVIATGSFRDSVPVVGGRWNGWKYIEAGDEKELYNLGKDPAESKNVVKENPGRVSTFQEEIPGRVYGDNHSAVPTNASEEVSQRLEDLGYLE
jgi:arylsulfatase A-like enzyme